MLSLVGAAVGMKAVLAGAVGWGLTRRFGGGLMVGLGLAQIGEFSFVVAQEATRLELMSSVGHGLFFGIAVPSMALTPGLLALARWLEDRPAWVPLLATLAVAGLGALVGIRLARRRSRRRIAKHRQMGRAGAERALRILRRAGYRLLDTEVTAVGAILAALFARERDPEQRGQRVEVAMLDAYAAFALPDPMTPRAFPPDFEQTGMSDAFFRAWETADGHVVGLVIQDHQFAALCRVLDRTELVTDPRFQEMGTRLGNYVELVATLKDDVRKWASADFVARAREEGATFGPVNDVEAFLADPQVRHRETVRILVDERFGPTQYLAPPWGFSRTPASIDRHAPRLGEHSDEILAELGLDENAIRTLREQAAIR